MTTVRSTPGGLVALALALSALAPPAAAEEGVDYQRQIRPILSDKCFKCHGPDARSRRGGLRLDEREAALAVLQPASSALLERVLHPDPDRRMPPADSKLRLDEVEIDLLRRWIAEGAAYTQHWSFAPLRRPDPPAVRDAAWPVHPLDRFVLARLEAEDLRPAAPADRARWYRRARFDLTGLPPSLDELDRFLADAGAGAEQRAVERLLSLPAYGERMAAHWLDVARYSDTYGYQVDRDRSVWRWRDWVIRAFDQNLPYDQFLTWQLAGDLLPDAGPEQVLATTFNRLHPQKVEGGSVPEEFRVEYTADRTHTTATAFLGLTMECARCHDHKYDPLPQRDYYRLYAFFNNIDEAGLYSYFTSSVPTPTLRIEEGPAREQAEAARDAVRQAEQDLASWREGRRRAFLAWLGAAPAAAPAPVPLAQLDFEGEPGGENQRVPGKVGSAVRLSGDDGIGVGVGNFSRSQPFSVSLWMRTPDRKERAVVFHRSRAWTDAGSRGYQLLLEDGRLSFSLIHFWPGNALRVRTTAPVPIDQWLHVTVCYDGSSRAAGVRLYVDGRAVATEVVRDQLDKNITGGGGDHITIGERFRDKGFTGGLVDEFLVFDRRLSALEVDALAGGARLAEGLGDPAGGRDPELVEEFFEYYLAVVDPEAPARRQRLRELRDARSQAVDGIEEIMVMRELEGPRRPTFILERGAYDAPGEAVEPGTPQALPPMREGAPRDRLGLARWMTRPDHPLTARVAANRLWQLCFGDGLVRTPEDFGSQGEAPTHPALLDWLACELIDSGWDQKALLARIVTSATYRQDSRTSDALRERDPQNRLLARAPRFRLPAEMLRDQCLAVSGLLVDRIGGPPARPYELTESFKAMNRDEGDGLYRRSVYTFWKRTGPAPAMMALDAAKRDVCMVRRERTASPLQALVLLNGPQFLEAARKLGERAVRHHGDDDDAVVREVFRRATSRLPDATEQEILVALLREQQAHFTGRPEAAAAFLGVGDAPPDPELPAARLAAAGMMANAVLNYDECVIRR